MIAGVVLALVASLFTASASVTQRFAAAPAPGELAFSPRLILYLIRKPLWFLGILCMILGFVFQVAALRVSTLALVQPVIAVELLFVFAFLAFRSPRRVSGRDWFAAVAMALGLAGFLAIARPHGGGTHASHTLWLSAAVVVALGAALFWVLAVTPLRTSRPPSRSRRAALLAISAGIVWGFVAAVIKELSGHLSGGLYGVMTNWSPYVLLIAGAAAFFLLSNAFQAGPLAASQPGLTIVDPLVASILGVFLFGDRIHHSPLDVVGEALALAVLVGGVVLLCRSPLVQGSSAERAEPEGKPAPGPRPASNGTPPRRSSGAPGPGAAPGGSRPAATAGHGPPAPAGPVPSETGGVPGPPPAPSSVSAESPHRCTRSDG